MKLENQVCTLEQAKKLSELGVVQGCSLFYYNTKAGQLHYNEGFEDGRGIYIGPVSCFSAFTVAELGVMLPVFPEHNWETYYLKGTVRPYFCHAQFHDDAFGAFENEANARAALLIHALENCFTQIETVNERLTTNHS